MLDWLPQQAEQHSEHAAMIDDRGQVVSFAQLERKVTGLRQQLWQASVRPGDRIFSLLSAGEDFIVLLHAARQIGAMLAIGNPRWTAAEISRAVELASPDCLFADAAMPIAARRSAREAGVQFLEVATFTDDVSARADVVLPQPTLQMDRPYTILFTSGTSGKPKAIVHKAANYWASTQASVRRLGSVADDVWLAAMPLHHVGGLSILLRCTILGTTIHLQNGFDPARMAQALLSGRVTQASVVPAMIDRLLEALGGQRVPPQLRFVLVGGAIATGEQLARAQAAGLPVAPTYGMTETTSQIATAPPRATSFRAGEVGEPLDVTEVRVVDSQGGRAVSGTGAIEVRGPTLALGQLEASGQIRSLTDADGWMATRDSGVLSPSGEVRILGRLDDIIVSGGENVSPGEVETALLEHPLVAEVAVVGRPHEKWGTAVTAVVVPIPGARLTLADLRSFAAGSLARYKLPQALELREDLPRTATGKLQRQELR